MKNIGTIIVLALFLLKGTLQCGDIELMMENDGTYDYKK